MPDYPYSSQNTFSEALKIDILPLINVLIPRHTPGFDSIAKDGATIGAEAIEVSLQTGENRGTGFRMPLDAHPFAGSVRIEKLKIASVDLIGALGITGHLLQGTKGAAHATADAFEAESKSIMGSFKDTLERVFFSSNGTGRLGTVVSSATVSGKTVVVLNKQDMLYVTEGELVQFMAASATADAVDTTPYYKITNVDYSGTNKITLSAIANPAITVGHGVYVHGSKDKEFMGMFGGVGDATHMPASGANVAGFFQRKDRNASQYFSATVINDLIDVPPVTVPLTPPDISKGQFTIADFGRIRDIMEFQKKRRPDCFWTTIPIANMYRDEVGEKVQYVNAQIIDADIKVPAYDNIPIRKSLYTPFGTIFGIVQDSFKFHPLATGTQIIGLLGQGQDGQTLRKRPNYDIYDSYLVMRGQIGWNNPYANVRYYCDNPSLQTTL